MRKATKQTRLDLWLDDADLALLDSLTDAWQVSRQRVIESALTYAAAANASYPPANGYSRRQRIPLNLDRLALAQIERLGAEASDSIRAALRAFYASHKAMCIIQ